MNCARCSRARRADTRGDNVPGFAAKPRRSGSRLTKSSVRYGKNSRGLRSANNVKVTKMHGARNDFVVVDRRADGAVDLVEFARWACDRRAGVGADGVITLEPSTIADVGMRIINADGSEAEMCGNGVRCAARWLDETHASDTIVFDTIAGRVTTQIVERGPQYLVRVAIGVPQVSALAMNGQIAAWFVNMGNPHVVVFCDDPANIDLETLAQEVQRQPRFANGTNVHLVAVQSDGTLRVRHWERGVGLTQACGT